eukprot:c38145_g1_i1 orf=135-461(+)
MLMSLQVYATFSNLGEGVSLSFSEGSLTSHSSSHIIKLVPANLIALAVHHPPLITKKVFHCHYLRLITHQQMHSQIKRRNSSLNLDEGRKKHAKNDGFNTVEQVCKLM